MLHTATLDSDTFQTPTDNGLRGQRVHAYRIARHAVDQWRACLRRERAAIFSACAGDPAAYDEAIQSGGSAELHRYASTAREACDVWAVAAGLARARRAHRWAYWVAHAAREHALMRHCAAEERAGDDLPAPHMPEALPIRDHHGYTMATLYHCPVGEG